MIKNACIVFLFSLLSVPAASAETFDHSQFDQILKVYVDNQGRVDYNGIAADKHFNRYLEQLASARTDEMTRDGRLAFWINAYNAVTIDKVIKWKPEKSVRETAIPGLWTSTRFFTSREHIVAGQKLSPDDIEHEILRKQLKDPRIHFAIVCASSSCPQLARDAYTEEDVQNQLEVQTRKYINSDRGTRIDPAENTLYLSKIFDWFAGDFKNETGSVLAFIKAYLEPDTLTFVERKPKIEYIRYNWALNAREPLK